MTELLEKFSRHYDPLYLGMGRPGLANGMHATCGQSFPRCGGGYNLYRGVDSPRQIDWDDPVGAAGKDAATISNFADRAHHTELVYHYALRAISPGGVEQEDLEQIARLAFDTAAQALLPPLESPADLRVQPVAEGRFRLRWCYHAAKPALSPKQFHVYTNNGSGAVDYNSIVATVAFRFWQWHYEYLTDPFDPGQAVSWAVRTVNSAEQEERNVHTVSATADADGPPPNNGVTTL